MANPRVIILVLDACGVGAAPDAAVYGDALSATLPHVASAVGGLKMPHSEKLGLGWITDITGVRPYECPLGAYGKLTPQSPGKDSTTGHWELAGLVLDRAFPLFPNGFPDSVVKQFERLAGVAVLGNMAASGTEIIARLGEEHLGTGKLILYTSADSVFQLAAHESVCPVSRLYEICEIARELLQGEFGVARVIARPFVGEPGAFVRTPARRDFSLPPRGETILDTAHQAGLGVLSIGKIYDLFAGRGLSNAIKTANNNEVMGRLVDAVMNNTDHRLIFANCVDFDMLWGHRNDAPAFARGLEEFDIYLGTLLSAMKPNDILLITADHGCDPTITTATDHTREFVPAIVYGKHIRENVNLGTRSGFSDLGATVADILGLPRPKFGQSFWSEIRQEVVS
ncbi:phosphopentomutase [candidate division GN15 bacterium]|uniref:Phosphopentomutase n=1 Tax=candidate division GN15 bacterium TaxID=2072418 RepID=A0A855X4H8_9BACT|nr:MAG: phosphopentomutase [candidate division GN15 bacterium]